MPFFYLSKKLKTEFIQSLKTFSFFPTLFFISPPPFGKTLPAPDTIKNQGGDLKKFLGVKKNLFASLQLFGACPALVIAWQPCGA